MKLHLTSLTIYSVSAVAQQLRPRQLCIHNHSYLVVRKYEERASACRMGHHCHKLRVDGAEHLRITIFWYPNRLEKLVLLERLPKYISELAFSHKSTRHFTLILQSLHQKPFLWLFELAASALVVCEQMGVVFTLKMCTEKNNHRLFVGLQNHLSFPISRRDTLKVMAAAKKYGSGLHIRSLCTRDIYSSTPHQRLIIEFLVLSHSYLNIIKTKRM